MQQQSFENRFDHMTCEFKGCILGLPIERQKLPYYIYSIAINIYVECPQFELFKGLSTGNNLY